jgi:hypothetical protein
MTWGTSKDDTGENTESYRLFTRKRHVAVDFDLYVRNIFSASMIFFRHTSLATTSYPVDADDVSMIDDRRFVMVNVSQFRPSEFVDAENVSIDRRFVMVVHICDLYLGSRRCRKCIDDVKELYYRPEFSIDDR